MNLKAKAKQVIPDQVWQFGRDAWDGVKRIKDDLEASLHPVRRESIRKLQALKDAYKGERCVIIGNGPSLKITDVQKIRNEYTFGMNRIYLAWEEWGFSTSFFVTVNDLVIEQCAQEIQGLSIPLFLTWRSHHWLEPQPNIHYLYTTYTGPTFAKDVSKRLWEGATVTYTALQLAYHLGFTTVLLIGVDHSYVSKGKPNQTIVSEGDDPNHFNPHYFGKGFRWQLPDLETSEIAYKMAKQVYQEDGRQILDATIGGQLDIFPKVDFERYFSKK
jgi:hypothetical protein